MFLSCSIYSYLSIYLSNISFLSLFLFLSLDIYIYPYHPFLLAASSVFSELMYVIPWWSAYVDASMCRSPLENNTWVHPHFSSIGPHTLFVLHGCFVKWIITTCTFVVLLGVASSIFSKQRVTFLYNFHVDVFHGYTHIYIYIYIYI